jgi:hypothetical protein
MPNIYNGHFEGEQYLDLAPYFERIAKPLIIDPG